MNCVHSPKVRLPRRRAIGLLSSSIALCACARPALRPSRRLGFDLTQPEDQLRAYVKLAGSLAQERIFIQYHCEIIAILPRVEQKKLFKVKGVVRSDWTPNADGSFSFRNYDQGLFCDWESEEVIDSYDNPFTGEKNTPLHYKSGALTSTIGFGEGRMDPSKLEWRRTGAQVTAHRSIIGGAFDNPVEPKKWPKASTGETVKVSSTSTYIGDARDLEDPNLNAAPADHVWTFVANYPAWMKVGDMPGFALWRWVARKFSNPSEIDLSILAEIEKRAPGYLEKDKPWEGHLNGWKQYAKKFPPEI